MPDTLPGDEGNGRLMKYRVDEHERKLSRLEDWRDVVDEDRTTMKGDLRGVKAELNHLANAVQRNNTEVGGLRKVIVGASITFAGSALIFAFSILTATGKL
jgi:hypothetical protein